MTDKIKLPLFFTRLSIAYFLLPWILMRFTDAKAAQGISAGYYKMSWLTEDMVKVIGVLWLLLLIAFVLGFKKRISYGLVLLLHVVGTLTTIPYLIIGMDGMRAVFFAAIPTIGAMWLLYALREHDTIGTIDK